MSLLVQYFWFCLFFILVIFNSFISCQDESQLFGQPDTISEKEIQLVAQVKSILLKYLSEKYWITQVAFLLISVKEISGKYSYTRLHEDR